ncbi:MAG TPA: tetratricopeptide repeat protein [Bacteroidales bacterium]|nr:tetratricopeptide repeat protein [Bacteroidales bacterium]
MNKFLVLCLILLITVPRVNAQKEEVGKTFDDARFFYSTEEYKEAAYLFRKLVKTDPENANYNFMAGMSLLKVKGEETRAIPYLEKAVRNTTLKYKENDPGEKQAPYHAWFYLGNAYRINNQLDEALEAYSKFMDIKDFDKKYNLGIVQNEIKAAERAKIIKDAPLNLIREKMPAAIDDGGSTFRPVVNINETTMVYMKSLKFYDAIMYSYKLDGQWVEPINITPQVGSDGDMTPAGLSADGTQLLLVRSTKSDDGDIYLSKLDGHKWSKAEKMGKNVNSNHNEAHASFSPDGGYLLLSSDRRGGYGGLDIYMLRKEADGQWGEPENMGATINTPEDESSAFMVNDDETLYFCTRGHFNMGGYDIFYARRMKNGQWEDPKNLGYPLNTTNDNDFFQPVKSGRTGYISFFDRDQPKAAEEIYRVEILPYTAPATVSKALFNDSFSLILQEEDSGDKITVTYDSESDSMTVISPGGKSYDIKLIRKEK